MVPGRQLHLNTKIMARIKKNTKVRRVLQRNAIVVRKREKSKWEFLVRTFDSSSLTFMKSLGGMYPSIQPSGWMPGVYCHYLSSDLIPEQLFNTWNFSFGNSFYTAVIHPDALKNLSFTVCKGMMYGRCINPYLPENKREQYQVMARKDKDSKKVSMKKLTNWINRTLNPSQFEKLPIMDEYNLDTGYTHERTSLFPRTHEVIFKKIPLEYICAIITSRMDHVEAVKEYMPDIPVILVEEPSSEDKYYYRDVIVPILEELYKTL